MITSKTIIITTLIILLNITYIVAKSMPVTMAPPTPPSEGPIPGIAILVVSALYYGIKRIKKLRSVVKNI